MTTPDIALARRFWMHVHEGGTLTSLDVGRMVTALEDLDTAFSNLHREYERRGDMIADLEAKLAAERGRIADLERRLKLWEPQNTWSLDAGRWPIRKGEE